jgi:ABC-type transport system involved in multi-copper enzyme maturation permease subunit
VPIYEQSYRRWEQRAPLRTLRFWPITREALRLLLAKKAFLGLLVLAWVPVVGFAVGLWASTQFEQAGRVMKLDGTYFARLFYWQVPLTLLLTAFSAAGLMADDLRTGGILVYLSRPLTQRDYMIGKLLVPLAVNLFITLGPASLLYLVALSLAPDKYRTFDMAWLWPALAVHSFVVSSMVSIVALTVSALSRSARVAGLGFVGLLMGLEFVRGIVRAIFRVPEASLISLSADLHRVGDTLFGVRFGRPQAHWMAAAAVLACVALACLALIRSRVRGVEVVR